MARGGKRAGAGRKEGGANVKSKEIAQAALTSGKKTPLEVMLEAMYFAMEQVAKTENVIEKKLFYQLAHEHAKDAAPYMHAKLANIEVQPLGADGKPADQQPIVVQFVDKTD